MDFDEAGAFPIAYISSHVAIRWQGRLEPGETLLVLGAAGGVGLTAVEIGKAMGARVIAGASTAEKLAVARERGADEGVNYASEKLTERVMELTGGKGADVCFDPIGGELFDAALSALGWGGRILLVGFVGGVQQIPANRLLVKHRAALGSSLRYFRWHAPDKLKRLGRRAAAVVSRGQAPAAGERPPAAGAQRRGHSPADRPPGPRQARGAAGAGSAMEIHRVEHARPRRRADDRQPAAHERHDPRR